MKKLCVVLRLLFKNKNSFFLGLFFVSLLSAILILKFLFPIILKYRINSYMKTELADHAGVIRDLDLTIFPLGLEITGFQIWIDDKGKREIVLAIDQANATVHFSAILDGEIHFRIWSSKFKYFFLNGLPDRTKLSLQKAANSKDKTNFRIERSFNYIIDDLKVVDSEIHYKDTHQPKPVDIFFDHVNLKASRLQTGEVSTDKLQTQFRIDAKLNGHGSLQLTGGVNFLIRPKTFDYNFRALQLPVANLNNYFKSYGGFTVGEGTLDLFSEGASVGGKLKGYIKPILSKLKISQPQDPNHKMSEGKHAVISTILKIITFSAGRDHIAAKVPFDGTTDDIHFDIVSGVKSALEDKFIKPLKKKLDHDIDIHSPVR